MKQSLAFLLTVGLIALVLFFAYRRSSPSGEGPERTVWRMLDESREGNVEGYLDCFAAGLRRQLEAAAQGMGRTQFADYLKESSAKLKGAAIMDIRRDAEGQASLTLEYVYADRNERQRVVLLAQGGTWRIESTQGSQHIQPPVPYGRREDEVPSTPK